MRPKIGPATFRYDRAQELINFTDRFRDWLFKSNKTSAGLARELGCGASAVTRWKNGEALPTYQFRQRIELMMLAPTEDDEQCG